MQTLTLNASKKTKSTPAGEIPVDWGSENLSAFVEALDSGVSVVAENRAASNFEPGVLKVNAVKGGRFFPGENKVILPAWRHLTATNPAVGCVIISRSNTPELVGAVGYVGQDYPNLFLPDTLWQIRFRKDSSIDGRWLTLVLTSDHYRKVIGQIASGTSANMKKLQKPSLLKVRIPIPPVAEQRKIADILSAWDEALVKLDALIEAKERQRKGLMQRLLTGSLRFPEFGRTPWRKVRMNAVMTRVFRPIKWAADKPLSLVSLRRRCGGLFRRADMMGADYKTQDLHELKPNDFLVSKRQVSHGAWGLVTLEFEGAQVSKEYAILVNTAPEALHMPFFGWMAQMPRMIRLARVASIGVHIEKLIFDPTVFLRETIRIPPTLAEQQQITKILDACAAEARLLNRQRTAIDQQKRGLMQRLLTGRIRTSS